MKYCKKCLQPDTRPGVVFDEEGVCYACRYEEQRKATDWSAREEALKAIAEEARSRSSSTPYDCVVGVSGGKDSTFQAFYARDKLGLRPLLVNALPDGITDVGRHNLENLVSAGFDAIHLRPNPKVVRSLFKRYFYSCGNPVKPTEYFLWASSYIAADFFNIPLIIQGENAALTLGTAGTGQSCDDDAYSVVNLDTMAGGNALDLVGEDVVAEDLFFYQVPNIESMKNKGIRAIFLQYYAKEWSQVWNADFAVSRGLWGRAYEDLHDIGRYRRFTALDSDMVMVNQMLKYLKFGFGFATDEACYDIREGRLTREDAIWLVKEYDGKCGDSYIRDFCRYIDISVDEFWDVADRFVNKKLFVKEQGRWVPRFQVGIDFDED